VNRIGHWCNPLFKLLIKMCFNWFRYIYSFVRMWKKEKDQFTPHIYWRQKRSRCFIVCYLYKNKRSMKYILCMAAKLLSLI
jgi:hypothetical protein